MTTKTLGQIYSDIAGRISPDYIEFRMVDHNSMIGNLVVEICSASYETAPNGITEIQIETLEVQGPSKPIRWGAGWKFPRAGVSRWVNVETGEISFEYDESEFDEIVTPDELVENGHDVCFYCGADNGPNGESRVGFDCCQCGAS